MENREISSFRDPAGYIYYENDRVYRKINRGYFECYDRLMNSGLYDELVSKGYLINHKEICRNDDYIIIEVDKVPFISYPYEWCFLQLRDAAVLTLDIQNIALKYNMVLKDASGYNIQFYKGKVIFIDTLSFDLYEDGMPWGAYGQFCRHFMGPLLLMRYVDESLNCLLRDYIDGIPVSVTSNILKGRGGFSGLQHIKWHSKSILKNNDNLLDVKRFEISKNSVVNMVDMMKRQILSLKRRSFSSEWDKYYDNTNYTDVSDECKVNLVKRYLKNISFSEDSVLFDMGANDGKYSRIALEFVSNVVSFDIDCNCVNRNYVLGLESDDKRALPLVLDFNNPSPSIGFGGAERKGINDRGGVKCVMALALIHHIAISNNVPFGSVVSWFSKLGEYLVIEFVPKDDSQVEKLLRTRKDIFNNYDKSSFEKEFSKYYDILEKRNIKNSKRILYFMRVIDCE